MYALIPSHLIHKIDIPVYEDDSVDEIFERFDNVRLLITDRLGAGMTDLARKEAEKERFEIRKALGDWADRIWNEENEALEDGAYDMETLQIAALVVDPAVDAEKRSLHWEYFVLSFHEASNTSRLRFEDQLSVLCAVTRSLDGTN